ncbi:MAG TPA: small multi-drug export protein [Armatimonadota bacterium]|nr:small multi-drug export protein [Armatimonadota bacterium]
MNEAAHGFLSWLAGLDPLLAVVVISALPWIELRGGIPVGIALLGLPAWKAVIAALLGNALAVTPVVVGAKLYQGRLERWRWSRWLMAWSLSRARKHERFVNRYGSIGLALLVAIPIPGTGAWSASAISILIGMRLAPTLLAVYGGLLVCAGIILAATSGIMLGADFLAPAR